MEKIPLLEEMTVKPLYMDKPFMVGAFLSLCCFLSGKKNVTKHFKEETGQDITSLLVRSPLEEMIDRTTGYEKDVLVEWLSFVAKYYWGTEK